MPRSNSEKSSDGSLTSEDEGPVLSQTAAPSAPAPAETSKPHPAAMQIPIIKTPGGESHSDNGEYERAHDDPPRSPLRPMPVPFMGSRNGGPTSAASKWKTSTQRVMQLQKHAAKFAVANIEPGAEPGADPRRPSAHDQWGHISDDCTIQIVDYSDSRANFLRADNAGLIRFLTTAEGDRPSWSKVRWINIGGISWDVISTLALEYDLHPLSIEDVLHSRRTSMSKADYYTKHLFISTLCHTVEDHAPSTSSSVLSTPPDSTSPPSRLPGNTKPVPLSASPSHTFQAYSTSELPTPATAANPSDPRPNWLRAHLSGHQSSGRVEADSAPPPEHSGPEDDNGVNWIFESVEGSTGNIPKANGKTAVNGHGTVTGIQADKMKSEVGMSKARKQAAEVAFLDELKGEDRVMVDVSNLYIFFLRNGTVITIYKKQKDGQVFGAPILRRLRSAHMLMRRSSDASLLLQGILDYVVDKGLEVVDRYHDRILKLERSTLIHAKMTIVRELHVLSGDLTLHKRTLAPIKSLIYGMRRYDLDRCKALVVSSNPNADQEQVKGFLSHQAKIYLADVNDHMDYILESMDMFGTITENLISYTFNTISYQTNETMRRLSLATIIFFPLTFLTGYFGMNFVDFGGIENSDTYFWKIAIPVTFAFLVAWTWHDIERAIHVVKKRAAERRYNLAVRARDAIPGARRKTD